MEGLTTMTTPIFGTSTVSLEAAQAWARSRGAHQRFVDVAQWFWKHAPAYGIPPEIPYGLASWETNWGKYTGVVPWTHHNWGGIKTKNGWSDTDPKHHQVFANDEAGAIAVIQHLYRYGGKTALPTGETLIDPRYGLVTKFTDTVEGLGGAWAPAATYGQNVAGRVADVRDFANNQTWEPPMSGDDARFKWVPDTSEFGYPTQGTHGRSGKPIDYLIIHVTEGTDSLKWLTAGNGSSAHYLTNRDATPRAQMVAEADAAWTAGSREYNERGINIEFERFARDKWTDAEYRNAAETCLPIIQRRNIPMVYLGRDSAGKRGILGHQDVPDGKGGWGGSTHHNDPGPNFSFDRFIRELEALVTPAPPAGKWIIPDGPNASAGFQHGFRTWLETQARARFPDDLNAGALAITGYPEADEYGADDGCSYQVCQRMTLRWMPNTEPPWDIVPLLRDEPIPPPKGSES